MPFSQFVPCAVPLWQPGALRCSPLASRRLSLSRLSPPGALHCPPRDAERHIDTKELWKQRRNLVHELRALWPSEH
eukprot:3941055-Pleurochrysis_carterae.AAC.1